MTYQQVKSSEVKIGKYRVGLPLVSDSYKRQTPKPIKIASETLVFIGGAVTLIAASFTPPAWVIAAGGLATLTGRFLFKCFSE